MTQINNANKTKNIILCSDGTGNKGGAGAETNVFQLYNAIDIHDPALEQVVFYENGVGTQKNKIIKGISGAFGFGFGQNVKDLYEFLVRQYEPGDNIYMFGFSRGAATIRGFAGFLQICGLVDKFKKNTNGDYALDVDGHKVFKCDEELGREMDEAFCCYQKNDPNSPQTPHQAEQFKAKTALHHETFVPNGNVPIKFIGVWDTVSALGFPDGLSPLAGSIMATFQGIINRCCPHLFYNYQLNENVKHVFHALSLDDERRTFHPKVWREIPKPDEPLERPKNIEQVWFAGMHSNVGGGYTRKGLSNVTFDWMLERAQLHGLKFISGFCENIKERVNVHGRLYDSRDGLAFYYRYAPRNLPQLCTESGKIASDEIKIHNSVLSRMKYRTSEYAPAEFPREFKVVSSSVDDADTGHSDTIDNLITHKAPPFLGAFHS
ncbi:DUF2235 domain-containing protein [sulfur-oxidizing endosymbiont of Gigantopelta aegis]|uniref:DUF2235 domain-containing protein n=1 Tax=sulfur-oxidizing endosymbiont of Gigantopelta aegis TaxID=2794934 RepID=UPI0018DC8865|nr:DUF2235 domain-containing protein [sulfur-oxidizing endosymbiont of Gigantopelta aegis]